MINNSKIIQGQFPGGKPIRNVILLRNALQPGVIQNRGAFKVDENKLNFKDAGKALPQHILQKMEPVFKFDFSNVRIHTGGRQAESVGAIAFTTGNDIYFAQGQYNPNGPNGQRLLGHELTHVVQQKNGKVKNPFGNGVAVVHDPGLEAEAERMALLVVSLKNTIQPKMKSNTLLLKANRYNNYRSSPGLYNSKIVQRASTGSSISKSLLEDERKAGPRSDRVEKTFQVDDILRNALEGLKRKGWTETEDSNIFIKTGGLSIQTKVDDGNIYGKFSDTTNTLYKTSYMGYYVEGSRSDRILVQTYTQAFPEHQGIGYILSYVGARHAKSIGINKVKATMINQNSARLADQLSRPAEDSSCWSRCFLTTACVEMKGLPDDCEELTVLRSFRDNYMLESDDRKKMVELYYEIAPLIVEAIKNSESSNDELEYIYNEIKKCVVLIKAEKFEEAMEIYKSKVIELANKYLKKELNDYLR